MIDVANTLALRSLRWAPASLLFESSSKCDQLKSCAHKKKYGSTRDLTRLGLPINMSIKKISRTGEDAGGPFNVLLDDTFLKSWGQAL